MPKIVGIDLGTNSVGINIWDKYNNGLLKNQIESSVDVFRNGVSKGNSTTRESSLAAERTTKRSKRHLVRSARTRKQATLKHLIKYGYCPLSMEELNRWRFQNEEKGYDRTFPSSDKFMQWINMNFEGHENGKADYSSVYQLRNELMTRDFDFENSEIDRYKLVRALYNIAIHRGFKSNKGNKAGEEDKEDEMTEGNATSEIKKSAKLRQLMAEKNLQTIGQAFYYLEKNGAFAEGEKGFRVRNSEYTADRSLYYAEIKAIFQKQHFDLDSDFCKGILSKKKHEGTIFYKRPLSSQKGNIARCFLEPDKTRCYISHPEFEEFRALQLINNIRIKLSENGEWIGLDDNQRQQLYKDEFLNSSKDYFKFSDIREYLEDMFSTTFSKQSGTINYKDATSVSRCPVTVRLNRLFEGKKFNEIIAQDNSKRYTVEDVWHICNTCDDEDWLKEFAKDKLHFDSHKTKELTTLWNNIPEGYSNLSLKAIRRINRMLRKGMVYSDAVMFAKLPDILGEKTFSAIEDSIMDIADEFIRQYSEERNAIRVENAKIESYIAEHPNEDFGHAIGKFRSMPNKMDCFKHFMHRSFPEVKSYTWDRLYHHSDVSLYPVPPRDEDGNLYLADPIKGRILPPAVKRTLCILRKRINSLIKRGKIDPDSTRIVIETARDMCDANMKWAIDTYNARREDENKKIEELIKEFCEGYADKSVTPEEITKARLLLEQGKQQNDCLEAEGRYYEMKVNVERYKLWKEQDYISIYTGNVIPLSKLFTDEYDIDHTLPISLSFDDSLENKTICEAYYNRKIKKILLPTALPDYEHKIRHSIVLDIWKQKVERLKKQVDVWDKKARRAADPESKNECIRQKYTYRMELDYWEGKLNRFFVNEIDDKFRNNQLNDTRIITRYAMHYMKSVFQKVSVQRGETTARFREILGIEKKDRSLHYHHAIDALILSLIPHARLRDEILQTYYEIKEAKRYGTNKQCDELNRELRHKLMLAGISYSEVKDAVEKIKTELIVDHERKDVKMVRDSKNMRIRGKVVKGKLMRGDVVKGQLHLDTLYGAIKLPDHPIQYVSRKPLKSVKKLDEIVDPQVRWSIERQMQMYGIKSLASSDGKPMWMMRNVKNEDGTTTEIIIKEDKNGRPLLPIRHVRVFSSPQINAGNIPIKKTERKSKKALVRLSDREHKDFQYAVKGDFIACLVYSTINEKNKLQRGYRFLTDFDIAEAKRKNRDLASRCKSLKEFIMAIDDYVLADIPQYSNNTLTGYIKMKIERVILPGTVLIEKDENKSLSERTFIVRNCNYNRKSGVIWASNHLVADVTDTKNLIEIRPSKLSSFDIAE